MMERLPLSHHGRRKPVVAGVLVQPNDGVAAVLKLLDAARWTLVMKHFEFDCEQLVATVVAAKARGVAVRVMLNPVRSSGLRPNDGTFATFQDVGIDVEWTSPHFLISHEKSVVIDGRYVLIATFNFSERYFSKTRDYGVLLDDLVLAQEVTTCFDADRRREPFVPLPESPLAWGNQNARRAVAGFIDGAKSSLAIQHLPVAWHARAAAAVIVARAGSTTPNGDHGEPVAGRAGQRRRPPVHGCDDDPSSLSCVHVALRPSPFDRTVDR